MTYFSRGRITAFTDALAHALYDFAVAKEREILFLCDSNVVYRMLFGFTAEREEINARDELVEALLSAGYLGAVHLLRPHAIELHALIQRKGRKAASGLPGTHEIATRRFLEQRGALQGLQRLLEATNSGGSLEDRTAKFLQVLRDVGASTFVAVELTYGTWQERLRRLHGHVLRFTEVGDSMRSLLEEPEAWRLFSDIASRRFVDVPANNLTDATALVALQRLVNVAKESARAPLVRFYTTSPSIRRVIGDPERGDLRRRLTFDVSDEWKLERTRNAGFVFRTTDYYIVRASFDALRFPSVAGMTATAAPAPISIANLEDVLRELIDAIDSTGPRNDRALLQTLEKIRVGGRQLMDILNEIEHASFLERLFGDPAMAPVSFKTLIRDFRTVFAFINTGAPRRQMRNDIARNAELLTQDLATEGPNLRAWIRIVRDVRDRTASLATAGSHDFTIGSLERDLGLVRWGGRIKPHDGNTIVRIVAQLFSGDERQEMRACGEIAEMYIRPRDESACLAVCSVLWMLSLFERVVDAINRFARRLQSNQIPVALNLIRTAARVRARQSFSTAEKSDHLDGLEREVTRVDERNGRFYLGLAYVAYVIARSEKENIWRHYELGESETEAETRAPWACRSFRYSEKALACSSADTLAAAFAINHCAYVGSMSRIFRSRTEAYLDKLARFEGNKEVWNYRFADTLAFVAYESARQKWTEALDGELTAHASSATEEICALLGDARRVIDTAHPNFGDMEISEHIDDIGRLQLHVGCLGAESRLNPQPSQNRD